MGSQIISLSAFLVLSLYTEAQAQKTDIQKLLTPSNIPRKDLIKTNDLIRLWPLDSTLQNRNRVLVDDIVQGPTLVSQRSIGVSPVRCGAQTYARFNQGAVISDETLILKNLLKNASYNSVQLADDYLRKKMVFVNTKTGLGEGHLDPYTQLHSRQLIKEIRKPEIQTAILNSTSLVKISDQNRQGRLQVENSDYTIGGWFKAEQGERPTSIFKKYFTSDKSVSPILEWQIFSSGNMIFFHGNHDAEVSAEMKYLSNESAQLFRSRNSHFYGPDDTYEDLVEKKAIQDQMSRPKNDIKILPRVFVDMPIAHKAAKPVPPPHEPPSVSPPVQVNPPFIPLPPDMEIPKPPYPLHPLLIGYTSSGKDHPLLFDIKLFWWGSANSLGQCTGCVVPNRDHDIWHFFAISVHLNDPLGPYLDLMIIRDPNERLFGKRATLSTHYRTRRVFLNPVEMSRPYKTPVAHGYITEKNCPHGEVCTRSELEIGGLDASRPFNGYMRGVFIAKKALTESSILRMAAEFNPLDTSLCSYNQRP